MQAATICEGDSVHLFASGGKSYTWSPAYRVSNPNNSAPFVHPDSTITYHITVCDTFCGCKRTDSVIVKVNPTPKIKAGANQYACQGQKVTIGETGLQDYKYQWSSRPAGFKSPLLKNSVEADSTITYFLSAKDAASGCSSADSTTVFVYPVAKPQLSGTQTVCQGDTQVYLIQGYNKSNTYAWHVKGGHLVGSGTSFNIITWDSAGSNSIYLVETTSNQCKDSALLAISSTQLPVLHISATPKICLGNPASFTDSGTNANGYRWSFGDGDSSLNKNAVYTYSKPGIYHVNLAVANGHCQNKDSAIVEVFDLPLRRPFVSHTGFRQYQLENDDSNFIVYQWNTGDGIVLNNSNISHTYSDTGHYNIAFNYGYSWGCPEEFDTTIFVTDVVPPKYIDTVYIAPNPFSDHINIDFSHSQNETINISVFDPIGRLVVRNNMNNQPAGEYSINFPLWQISSGIYFLKYMAGEKATVFKIVKL